MIRPLRQYHRRLVMALGIFLPVAFALGIAARKVVPTATFLPAALVGAPRLFEAVEWERADLFAKSPVPVQLLREQTNSGQFAFDLTAPKDFVKPDLLVYWVEGNPKNARVLPANAILLGTFGATTLPLPDGVTHSGGALLLYSLANNEIIEVSQPIQVRDSTK